MIAFDSKLSILVDPIASIVSQLEWGRKDQLFTPAFWATQAKMCEIDSEYINYKIGNDLIEEVAACILGGYGMPSEIGLAAFNKIRSSGILSSSSSLLDYESILREPLLVNGRSLNYRFARQRSKYLKEATLFLGRARSYPTEAKAFRNFLLEIPGIGYKTASWITRNWLESDEVAIIDVHIFRACVAAGIFSKESNISKHYLILEQQFIAFAKAIPCRASTLDNFMWNTMKRIGHRLKKPESDQPVLEK